ncbi:MAG: hypothetical protein QOF18_887 [Frankiaceae bacterium]|jgi:hypothetical protein|nr:hypothetical protein [Frankiaceae bacterium]
MPPTARATSSATPLKDRVAAELRGRLAPDSEGSLWLALVDRRGRLALCAPVDEGTHHIDELFLRDLAGLIRTFDVPVVALVVHRASGRPTRTDRQLWHELTRRLATSSPTHLDLLVV